MPPISRSYRITIPTISGLRNRYCVPVPLSQVLRGAEVWVQHAFGCVQRHPLSLQYGKFCSLKANIQQFFPAWLTGWLTGWQLIDWFNLIYCIIYIVIGEVIDWSVTHPARFLLPHARGSQRLEVGCQIAEPMATWMGKSTGYQRIPLFYGLKKKQCKNHAKQENHGFPADVSLWPIHWQKCLTWFDMLLVLYPAGT